MGRRQCQTETDENRQNLPAGPGTHRPDPVWRTWPTTRNLQHPHGRHPPVAKVGAVSFASRILIGLTVALAVGVQAADQNIQLEHSNRVAPLEAPPGEALLERFKVAFNQGVDDVFVDRFHPFNMMKWNLELATQDHDHFRDSAANAARGAFAKSVVYGAREATVDLPVLLWLNERQGVLADFLRNSVDSVAEEEVAPLDLRYRPVERSWWRRLSESGGVHYGIRPFRTSPYTFVSLGIKQGDNLLMLAHVRYHYRNFADHRFEIALSVPLAQGMAFDVGTSYQFGRHPEEGGLVVKLFKEFKSGGIMHVGMEAREHPSFFAGIAIPW